MPNLFGWRVLRIRPVPLSTLHLACLAAGVLALGVQAVRGWVVGNTGP